MKKLLTEEQRHLMGISPREFGGVPAMFQRAQFEVPVVEDTKPKKPERDEEGDDD